MKKYAWMIVVITLAGSALASQSVVALYRQGNAAYSRGDFQQAISFYEQALAAGIHNSNLYYNLGNAYYKAGDVGRAALNWWRAERLSPRDADVRANLELLKKLAEPRSAVSKKGGLNEFLRRIRDLGSAPKWGIALSVCLWGFWLSLFWFLLLPGRRGKHFFSSLLMIFLVGIIFAGAGFYFRARFEREPAGVVMNAGASAKSGPGDSFPVLFEPMVGERVLIRDCRAGYCQIEIPPGMVGWVEGKILERI